MTRLSRQFQCFKGATTLLVDDVQTLHQLEIIANVSERTTPPATIQVAAICGSAHGGKSDAITAQGKIPGRVACMQRGFTGRQRQLFHDQPAVKPDHHVLLINISPGRRQQLARPGLQLQHTGCGFHARAAAGWLSPNSCRSEDCGFFLPYGAGERYRGGGLHHTIRPGRQEAHSRACYSAAVEQDQKERLPMKTFAEALQGKAFTITADLTLNSSSGADDVARQADLLGPHVDALQVTDNPWAWVQMSALAAAALVRRHGIDPVTILTCRDRNRFALQAELLGLRALGVTSLLLMRGHKIPKEHAVPGAPVFDMSGRELLAMAAGLNAAESAKRGEAGEPASEFFIGIGAKAFRPVPEWAAKSLTERSNAGARFVQTQLCLNMDVLRQYMQHLVETRLTWKYSVIVSLTPLPSVATARWLKKNLTDSRIPRSVIVRLEQAADPAREGVAICAELIREIAEIPGVSGVNLMTTGDPELLRDAIKASGLR